MQCGMLGTIPLQPDRSFACHIRSPYSCARLELARSPFDTRTRTNRSYYGSRADSRRCSPCIRRGLQVDKTIQPRHKSHAHTGEKNGRKPALRHCTITGEHQTESIRGRRDRDGTASITECAVFKGEPIVVGHGRDTHSVIVALVLCGHNIRHSRVHTLTLAPSTSKCVKLSVI